MRYEEINKRFTETVNDYMMHGYQINTASMSGSQGEVARVDLTNGEEIIRVYLTSFHKFENWTEGFEIVVGRCTDGVTPNSPVSFSTTIWNNKLEMISIEKFYKLYVKKDGETVYGAKSEAAEVQQKRFKRCYRTNNVKDYSNNEAFHEIAVRYLKRALGKRRISSSVTIMKRGTKYTIEYRDRSYTLA